MKRESQWLGLWDYFFSYVCFLGTSYILPWYDPRTIFSFEMTLSLALWFVFSPSENSYMEEAFLQNCLALQYGQPHFIQKLQQALLILQHILLKHSQAVKKNIQKLFGNSVLFFFSIISLKHMLWVLRNKHIFCEYSSSASVWHFYWVPITCYYRSVRHF